MQRLISWFLALLDRVTMKLMAEGPYGSIVTEVGVAPETRSNPLQDDVALFNMFMTALDAVVADSEIRGALEEFRLSPHELRGRMITAARQILETAPREYAAYEEARDAAPEASVSGGNFVVVDAPDALQLLGRLVARSDNNTEHILRRIGQWLGTAGLASAVAGFLTFAAWPWTEPLVWAGVMMLVASGLVYGTRWLRLGAGRSILGIGGRPARSSPRVDEARDRLMGAITHYEFLAQARTVINTARQDQFGHSYSVAGVAGLSETYDSTYQVPTSTAAELAGLLARLDGASLGVAGPRGSGKSTLIRGYCEDNPDERAQAHGLNAGRAVGRIGLRREASADLRLMVAAPVDYAARDFVLHLFAVFCRSVIARYGEKRLMAGKALARRFLRAGASGAKRLWPIVTCGAIAVILVHWQGPIARYLAITRTGVFSASIAIAVLGIARLAFAPARTRLRASHANARRGHHDHALTAAARRHLARVRYLQTRTTGWSGTLGLSAGSSGQLSRTASRAEQPLSYPEIVSEFRGFAREVAADLHGNGSHVFIGIDELDKIGAPEQAERFLNEIKGIFGIPHVYFMVSVSDDALTSFERRGLPLRDAFDSSFDEIIHVGALSYPESRRLLYRRVIGLTEPYVALCHCLSGGLARDLIRAARQVIRAGEALAGSADDQPELRINPSTAFLLLRDPGIREPPVLSSVCATVISDELRRKTRAVAQLAVSIAEGAQDLQGTLSDAARYLAPGTPAMKIVDIVSRPPASTEPGPVTALRLDLAAYAYYCATMQDVFTEHLEAKRMIEATTTAGAPGSFDALAAARQAFTLDTQLAWRSISEFRRAWSLETREPMTISGQ